MMVPPDSNDGVSSCGCKGIRRCLVCEKPTEGPIIEAKESKVHIPILYQNLMIYMTKTGHFLSLANTS